MPQNHSFFESLQSTNLSRRRNEKKKFAEGVTISPQSTSAYRPYYVQAKNHDLSAQILI
jgi:hypothetical protein